MDARRGEVLEIGNSCDGEFTFGGFGVRARYSHTPT
jgi:hypothetical protein